jgi:hypothetical protein
VRIYANALSLEEIQEIYQQKASLDNTGNLFSTGNYVEGRKVITDLGDFTMYGGDTEA